MPVGIKNPRGRYHYFMNWVGMATIFCQTKTLEIVILKILRIDVGFCGMVIEWLASVNALSIESNNRARQMYNGRKNDYLVFEN